MSELTVIDPRVTEFTSLVSQGIEAWQKAGKILCALVEEKPGALGDILAESPYLTQEILESFVRMGRRELYPYLVVDGSPGAKRLAALPYDQQVQLHKAEVPCVVWVGGATITRHKRVSALTKQEAERVFSEQGLRPVAEQMKMIRRSTSHSNGNGGAARREQLEVKEIASESDPETADLNADPKLELQRFLTLANSHLLEARSALVMVGRRDHPLDRHIAAALRAVGQLRFAINQGEI